MSEQLAEITDQLVRGLTRSLKGPSTSERYRIAHEVRQAAQGAFMRDRPARPTRIVKMLRREREALKSQSSAASDLSMELWPYLGIEDERQLRRLAEQPGALEKALDEAIELTETDLETQIDRAGGRRRDERIDRFVMSLVQIYERYTGERRTTTTDPETGELRSTFDVFVLEAFLNFYPEGEVPQGSVRTAIREAVKAEKVTDTFLPSTDELPEVTLPPASRTQRS